MNNSDTPTGGNGRKEMKITRTNEADKLLENYFENLREEGYGKIDIRALVFDVPEVAIKSKGGDENEQKPGLSEIINVLSNGKRTFELDELTNGVRAAMRLTSLDKVKEKVKQLKEQKQAKKEENKKSVSKTEKPNDSMERE